MATLEHDGKVFDSANSTGLTFGDIAALECAGVDLQALNGATKMPMEQTIKLATLCLGKLDSSVTEGFVRSIPLTKAAELTAVISDFLAVALPKESAAS